MILDLPRLRPDQSRIIRHPARVKVIAAGRRFGKTFMCGALAVGAAVHGNRVAWVVPTYKNARPAWRWIEQYLGPLLGKEGPFGELVRVNRSALSAEFARTAGGGSINVYSADNDVSIRGEAFHLIIVDEAARVAEATWTDVLLPTLADFGGQALLVSTPMGRNWFWREHERGRAQMDGEIAAFSAPTTDNPSPSIRRASALAEQRMPERVYRQEWLAEFLEDSGGVFRKVREAGGAFWQEAAIEGHRYAIGCDWGKIADFSVFTVIDTSTRPPEVCRIDRMNRVDYALQTERLQALAQTFHPDAIYAELNSIGVPIIEQLQRMGLPVQPFQTTNASKAQAIDALALAFERGELRLPDYPILVGELLAFQAERLPSGLFRYAAPEGLHDDCVMSLALAYQALAHQVDWSQY